MIELKLQPFRARSRLSGGRAGGQKHGGDAADETGEGVDPKAIFGDVDADELGGVRVAADGVDIAAEVCRAHEKDQRGGNDQENEDGDRDAQQPARPDPVVRRAYDADPPAIGQDIGKAPEDRHCREGRDDCVYAACGDQNAVCKTAQRGDDHGGGDPRQRKVGVEHRESRRNAGNADDGADRNVNAARYDDDRLR